MSFETLVTGADVRIYGNIKRMKHSLRDALLRSIDKSSPYRSPVQPNFGRYHRSTRRSASLMRYICTVLHYKPKRVGRDLWQYAFRTISFPNPRSLRRLRKRRDSPDNANCILVHRSGVAIWPLQFCNNLALQFRELLQNSESHIVSSF